MQVLYIEFVKYHYLSLWSAFIWENKSFMIELLDIEEQGTEFCLMKLEFDTI